MSRSIHPYALGATLYMPIVHPDALDVALGRKLQGLRSVVLCLEDSLSDADVPGGLIRLRWIMDRLAQEERDPVQTPLVFLRPRNIEMAQQLGQMNGIEAFDGFVCPKVRPSRVARWADAVAGTDLLLMPTLETAEIFDPLAVRDLRDELLSDAGGRILALRIGGNDLMGCLGLRRQRGMLLYDGPLAGVLSNLVGMMVPAGFSLTAPVFEIMDDEATFARETARDVSWGFVGKTVIHPVQIPVVHAAFSVPSEDLDAAHLILAQNAPAVFKHGGAMCEPATHAAWATAIRERARYHGLLDAPGPQAPTGPGEMRQVDPAPLAVTG